MDQAQKLVQFFPPDTSSNLFQNTSRGMRGFSGSHLPFHCDHKSEQHELIKDAEVVPLTESEVAFLSHVLTDSHLILAESKVSIVHILEGKKK